MKYGIVLITSLVVLSTNASGQGDEKGPKPEKVSSAMMQEATTDTTHHQAGHEEDTQAAQAFLGLYVLEDWFGIIALVVAPIVILIGLILIPYIDRKESIHSTMRKAIVWGYIYVGLTPSVKHL